MARVSRTNGSSRASTSSTTKRSKDYARGRGRKRTAQGSRNSKKSSSSSVSKASLRRDVLSRLLDDKSSSSSPDVVERKNLSRPLKRFLDQQELLKRRTGNSQLEKLRLDTQGVPEGYAFVPKGDVYVTRHCRAKTLEEKKVVYTVYNAKKDTTLGLYVPASIASEVQAQASATKAARAQAVLSKDTREGNKTRALLLAAYPNMPAADLSQILSHAFLKGSRRVGRSSKVRGGEKVKLRLAVEAHIRHCHTEYDRMLREGIHREDAREMVWEEVGRIRDEWAGRQEGEGGEGSESESVVEMEDEVDNVSDSEPDVIVLDSDSDEG